MKKSVFLFLVLILFVGAMHTSAQNGDKYTQYLALKKDELKALQLSAIIPGAGLDYIGTPEALQRKNYYIMAEGVCALASIGGLLFTEEVDLGYGLKYKQTSTLGYTISLAGIVGFYILKAQEKEEIRNLATKYNNDLKNKLGISGDLSFNDGIAKITVSYNF